MSEFDEKPSEKTKCDKSNLSLKDIVSNQLEKIGSKNSWVWTLFFLCVTPNILNGFHVSSYVFLGKIPTDMWCSSADFNNDVWTSEQIRNITENGLNSQGCTIWDRDYKKLNELNYDQALEYISNHNASEILCSEKQNAYYAYDESSKESSFVPEWNLVCERNVHRTSAQALLSIGKFIGASTFGILSDKYGRRTTFLIAAIVYIISSILVTTSPWYTLFLTGRMGLGAAASGLFYPAFAMLTENISVKYRSTMSIAFSASYPIGMLFLALAAYLVKPWRYLCLTLTIPALLLIINFIFMKESPRWLLMKKREAEAYQIVFKKKFDAENCIKPSNEKEEQVEKDETPLLQKIKGSFKEIISLYGTPGVRRMVFTCYFMWCVTSLCYYVTALNAHNLSANSYLYVAITGMVDIPSYIFSVILLKFMGRRTAASGMFVLAGVSLLIVLAFSQESTWLVFFAMLGRFGISGVYSVVTLFTAELFPTEIRNSALGTCSTMAHVGSITAPYIVDILGLIDWFIPTTICGISVLLAGLLILTLPETSTRKLDDHVVQNEKPEK